MLRPKLNRTKHMNESSRQPELVDSHVGARIRVRRKLLGHTQEELARALGITFQQVQKYERGSNRVSASKLYEVARFLSVPIAYFFEELPEPTSDGPAGGGLDQGDKRVHDFVRSAEGLELIGAFSSIENAPLRRTLMQLIRSVAQQEKAERRGRPRR